MPTTEEMEWLMLTATDKQLREWALTRTDAALFARSELARRESSND